MIVSLLYQNFLNRFSAIACRKYAGDAFATNSRQRNERLSMCRLDQLQLL